MGVAPISVPQNIAASLVSAGGKSGVDFNYLLQTAIRESSLNPSAKAQSSSAVGLFQFLESTWLEVMKSDGPRLGYQQYANAIVESDGQYTIADKKLRAEVLKLRENPQVAADLAAAFTRNNGAYLTERFGRRPSAGELYIAHFLGARGAAKLFAAGLDNPDQSAVALFPRQASANPTIFYDGGQPRTIKEVYRVLVAQHPGIPGVNPLLGGPSAAVAQQPTSEPSSRWSQDVVPSRFGPGELSFASLFTTEVDIKPRTLMTTTDEPVPQSPFFTQIYGQ